MNNPQPARTGILFLLSAPSGGGKSTLLRQLDAVGDFVYSVSCTTRTPRPGETHGDAYFFLTREEFETRIAANGFLEWAEVYGNYYGTPRDFVLGHLQAGRDVVMDLDVQGARAVRRDAAIAASLVDVFILPPSIAELRRRLSQRATETPEQLDRRMNNAAREMADWRAYQYAIVSGTPQEDFAAFRAIMQAERARCSRLKIEL